MAKKERMVNLELLRCVAMLMVVVLHYLGKGGLLAELTGERLGAVGMAAWLIEAFCIVAVNVYMFISGYFLSTSSFKLSRLLQLWLQVWFYSMVFGAVGAFMGVAAEVTIDTHYFLTMLFPVSMGHYWFMTAYMFLYVMLPLVGAAVQKMTEKQLRVTVILLLLIFSGTKSILPLRLETDGQGYDCIWYLCVFAAAAYLKRFGEGLLKYGKRWLLLYAGCSLLTFGATMGLRCFYLQTGSLGRMLKMCMEYNHVLPFLAALGLFAAFAGRNPQTGVTVIEAGAERGKTGSTGEVRTDSAESAKMQEAKGGREAGSGNNSKIADVICTVSAHTLGVYLLHENIGLRYSWQKWLGAEKISNVGSLFLWTAVAALGVFACGILTDVLRTGLMRGIDRLLQKLPFWRCFLSAVRSIDGLFQVKKTGGDGN